MNGDEKTAKNDVHLGVGHNLKIRREGQRMRQGSTTYLDFFTEFGRFRQFRELCHRLLGDSLSGVVDGDALSLSHQCRTAGFVLQ